MNLPELANTLTVFKVGSREESVRALIGTAAHFVVAIVMMSLYYAPSFPTVDQTLASLPVPKFVTMMLLFYLMCYISIRITRWVGLPYSENDR